MVDELTVSMLTKALQILEGNITYYIEDSEAAVHNITSSATVAALYANDDLPNNINNIALAVTKYIPNFNGTNHTGIAFVEETYVHVRWGWITLPLLLVVSGVVFLALAMFETRRHQVEIWKSSSLPLLFHGLSGQTKSQVRTVNLVSDMETRATETKVRLGKTEDDGWMLLTLGRSR